MPKPNWQLVGLCGIGTACFALLLATSPMLPMAWDEGNAIHRARGIRRWFGRFNTSWSEPFAKKAIDGDWLYTSQVEGHPAFYGTVIAAGESLTHRRLPPLDSARFGPMLLFAVAVAAAAYRLWRMTSPAAALVGAAAFVTLPRLFAHAHFSSFDGPLTSCWLLAWATFEPALRSRGWTVVWGVALGMTMSCKFTGWFAPVPFVFWAASFGDRRAGRALGVALPVAAMTFCLLNPPLWHAPLAGFDTFFDLNLGRAERPGLNIRTTYFGARYDMHSPLPWHNTLVWTAITVPIGTLVLFALGVGRALRNWRRRPEWLLLVGHWGVLVVVRATSFAPPHDAERLFLPSTAFLALLAALGADAVWVWGNVGPTLRGGHANCGRKATASLRHGVPELQFATSRWWLARGAVVAALLGSAVSTAWYSPQWLSYYNLLIGGLRGAEAVGMEPTYYWDGLDAEVLASLDEHTGQDEKIAFSAPSWENLQLMLHWGTMRVACLPEEPGRYRWYVIQRRPSGLSEADRRLIERYQPAFRKTIRAADAGWGPWRLDVPIVEVYEYADYARVAPVPATTGLVRLVPVER